MSEFNIVKKNFPKKKTKLAKKYLKIFNQVYKDNRDGKGLFNFLIAYLENWAHRTVSYRQNKKDKILEIGGGTLNHLKYEKFYKDYEVVEPFKALYQNSKYKGKIKKFYTSIFNIKKLKKYDRIISIFAFEHITDLPKVVEKCKNLLNKKGILQVAIPCEGEAAFKLGWQLTTALSFKIKYGLDYSKIMEHEHVNTQEEIKVILNNFFTIKKFKRSPFILPIKNFSFYCFFECEKK
jgi:2-polyprenyl-3-methyl-5-hydroxy-6-metoxy-1,4-benzoquinol methylase